MTAGVGSAMAQRKQGEVDDTGGATSRVRRARILRHALRAGPRTDQNPGTGFARLRYRRSGGRPRASGPWAERRVRRDGAMYAHRRWTLLARPRRPLQHRSGALPRFYGLLPGHGQDLPPKLQCRVRAGRLGVRRRGRPRLPGCPCAGLPGAVPPHRDRSADAARLRPHRADVLLASPSRLACRAS